jgi:putative redox protein
MFKDIILENIIMHNVRVEQINDVAKQSDTDPSLAQLDFNFEGTWNTETDKVQFTGDVKFPNGEITLEADFPAFLGGEGRAPSALTYCFYGAMSCYGSTFATQAAMMGVEIEEMKISLSLGVDFRSALGVGSFPPMKGFNFEVFVKSSASNEDIQKVKKLTDERCPAIWAMQNPVPYTTSAIKNS